MQFLSGGPILPDKLVREQERGEVLFICGAGASMTVGLPSFAALVQGVYTRLGERWDDHHAEAEIMRPGGSMAGQYDRALRCLERRLAASDVRGAGGLRKRIRDAVDAELTAPSDADMSNHLALMQLSRGSDGVPRLLTTNFDPLFERAWAAAGYKAPSSHAGASMPRQGTSAFEGVLHLHGRIEDEALGLAATDLVLTSAEFGDAYLRSGWASRYVYDLARALTLVLVGYQADDPPMRYLLEVLEDDRARYPDLRPVYAFAPARDGGEDLQCALWAAKGIEPIIYRIDDTAGHTRLYQTLHAWQDYAADPSAWRLRRLGEIFATPYAAGRDADEAASLLGREDVIRLLATTAPDPSWWPPLSGHEVLRNRPDALAVWIGKRRDDPDMLTACVASQASDHTVYDLALSRTMPEVAPEIARGWRLLSMATRAPGDDDGMAWYRVAGRIHSGDIDNQVRTTVVGCLQPRLRISAPFDWPKGQEHEESTRREMFQIEFVVAGDPTSRDVLSAWPDDTAQQLRLLTVANRSLGEALDQAADAGYLDDGDYASSSVPSLTRRVEFERGFAPLVLVIVGLWTRIAERDPESAHAIAAGWQGSKYDLYLRLHLHALTHPGLLNSDAVVKVNRPGFSGDPSS